MTNDEIKNKFSKRQGYFGQEYLSFRTSGFEITLDNFTPSNRFVLCLCTPYNEKIDTKKKHQGIGGGEVKESWIFEDENQALSFVISNHLV